MSIGLCVTINRTDFIYTGGLESGVVVGLINYPRFPASAAEITSTALDLANGLMDALSQFTATVQTPDEAIWITRRPEDQNLEAKS